MVGARAYRRFNSFELQLPLTVPCPDERCLDFNVISLTLELDISRRNLRKLFGLGAISVITFDSSRSRNILLFLFSKLNLLR